MQLWSRRRPRRPELDFLECFLSCLGAPKITVISVCRDGISKDLKSTPEASKALLGRKSVCKRHRRLPGELRGARALARRVCNMHGRIALCIAGSTGACPAGFARCTGACPMSCMMHGRLPNGFAICMGALPCGLHCLKKKRLQEAQAPARRVAGCSSACPAGLQYARTHCPMHCGIHGRLPGGFCKMYECLSDELHDAWALA
ncbi:hypothetical protein CRG98_026343 [Punica granatum]|uniref:Uncharacterized protein n=1 Tax=Punica granatum TaxID=22663 RepID=A0A2I0JB62_PUNGR|nr:hypothetical protein CRG98_026343 [Punica granatum]